MNDEFGHQTLTCGVLRVVFERRGDRFAHRVELLEESQFTSVYESLEGTEQAAWPTSPPMQSVHIEDRADGRRVALLVGMAGRSHWSAAVEADPATDRITFDVACRVQEEPAWLGSTYRIVSETPVKVDVIDQNRGAPTVEQRDNHLILTAPHDLAPLPCTVRWRYVISRS